MRTIIKGTWGKDKVFLVVDQDLGEFVKEIAEVTETDVRAVMDATGAVGFNDAATALPAENAHRPVVNPNVSSDRGFFQGTVPAHSSCRPEKNWRRVSEMVPLARVLSFYARDRSIVAFRYNDCWRLVQCNEIVSLPKTPGSRPYLRANDLEVAQDETPHRTFTLENMKDVHILD